MSKNNFSKPQINKETFVFSFKTLKWHTMEVPHYNELFRKNHVGNIVGMHLIIHGGIDQNRKKTDIIEHLNI